MVTVSSRRCTVGSSIMPMPTDSDPRYSSSSLPQLDSTVQPRSDRRGTAETFSGVGYDAASGFSTTITPKYTPADRSPLYDDYVKSLQKQSKAPLTSQSSLQVPSTVLRTSYGSVDVTTVDTATLPTLDRTGPTYSFSRSASSRPRSASRRHGKGSRSGRALVASRGVPGKRSREMVSGKGKVFPRRRGRIQERAAPRVSSDGSATYSAPSFRGDRRSLGRSKRGSDTASSSSDDSTRASVSSRGAEKAAGNVPGPIAVAQMRTEDTETLGTAERRFSAAFTQDSQLPLGDLSGRKSGGERGEPSPHQRTRRVLGCGEVEDSTSQDDKADEWDLNPRFLRAVRAGPNVWPDYILAKHPEFRGATPSPYLMYYFDETAPNEVLLTNDVRDEQPRKSTRPVLGAFYPAEGEGEESNDNVDSECASYYTESAFTSVSAGLAHKDRRGRGGGRHRKQRGGRGCCGRNRDNSEGSESSSGKRPRKGKHSRRYKPGTSDLTRPAPPMPAPPPLPLQDGSLPTDTFGPRATPQPGYSAVANTISPYVVTDRAAQAPQTQACISPPVRGSGVGADMNVSDIRITPPPLGYKQRDVIYSIRAPPEQKVPSQRGSRTSRTGSRRRGNSLSSSIVRYSTIRRASHIRYNPPAKVAQRYGHPKYRRAVEAELERQRPHAGLPPTLPPRDGSVSTRSSYSSSENDDDWSDRSSRTPSSSQYSQESPYGDSTSLSVTQRDLPSEPGTRRCSRCQGTGHVADPVGELHSPTKGKAPTVKPWMLLPAASRDVTELQKKQPTQPWCCGGNERQTGLASGNLQGSPLDSARTFVTSRSVSPAVVPKIDAHVTEEGGEVAKKHQAPSPAQTGTRGLRSNRKASQESHLTKGGAGRRERETRNRVSNEKAEAEKDLGYHVRKHFFDVEKQKVPSRGTGYKGLPQYSVSYKNYPTICYDVVVPTEREDFYRPRREPGFIRP